MKKFLFALIISASAAGAQNSPTPATIMAGIGTPSTNNIPCDVGTASSNTSSLYVQRDIIIGNAIWKCTRLPDGTFAWVPPFISPFIGTGLTGTITPPTIAGCQTGTATVAGATTAMSAQAAPIGSPGTGQINVTAYVSAANTVTVTLCLPFTLIYTANAVPYKVLVY